MNSVHQHQRLRYVLNYMFVFSIVALGFGVLDQVYGAGNAGSAICLVLAPIVMLLVGIPIANRDALTWLAEHW